MKYQPQAEKLISSHKSLKNIARNLVFIFLAFLVFIAFTPWQQTALGTGKVVALSPNERQQVISAPLEGRLAKWYVHDGSYVKKGDPIILLADNDPNLVERLRLEKKAIIASINLSKQAAQTALINVERQKKLFDEGISSRRKFEQAQFMYLKYQNDIAKAKVSLAKIEVRIARQQSQLVKSPLSGTIINRLRGKDSVQVKQGDPLATLIPDTSSRAVALWLDGNDIPLVHIGQTVRLQFEGWPAIQFSGWPSVAIGTFGGIVTVIDPIDNGKGLFRILVTPSPDQKWPGANYLRQGVKSNGWVMLSQVPVWFELWRRFNGFPPSIKEKPTESSEAST